MRAVIYARYSSDQQRAASIADQIRVCRAQIEHQGWDCAQVYSDRALSGASALRPAYQALLEGARAGRFEVVVAEGLDRLSRDQADTASLYKQLCFLGIRLVTLAEGEITELHVGLKGTMNALHLKDLAQKTHRGLEGRVRQGKSGGGRCYGYNLVEGETGARRINPAEAEVVRRIYRDFAAGRSPRAIAKTLNAEGIPGPHGRQWRDTAIRGHLKRGTGLLNNELYIGRLVWNRLTYRKDPASGKRISRLNPPEVWIVTELPELRIIDDNLWQAVKRRQGEIAELPGVKKLKASRFWERRRARHLLSGLVVCGCCGGHYAAAGRDYLACSAARGRGTCSDRRGIRHPHLEDLILDGLKQRLMAPELVEEFIRAITEEVNRQRRNGAAERRSKEQAFAEITRKLDGLIEALAEGFRSDGLQARLTELEGQKRDLERELAAAPPPPTRLHPNLAGLYRRKLERLRDALDDPAIRDEAREILRGLIDRVVVRPDGEGYEIEIHGEILAMVELANAPENTTKKAALDPRTARSVKVVAGGGFEPPTFRL